MLTVLSGIPPEAEQIVIRRVTPKTQEVDLHNGARLPAELIEKLGDKATMQIQEIAEQAVTKDEINDIRKEMNNGIETLIAAAEEALDRNMREAIAQVSTVQEQRFTELAGLINELQAETEALRRRQDSYKSLIEHCILLLESIDEYLGTSWSPVAKLVFAQIPQEEPSTLVLLFTRSVTVEDIESLALSGTTAKISRVISNEVTVELELDEPVDMDETNLTLSYSGTGIVDDSGQDVQMFVDQAVENNSTHEAITAAIAEIPAYNSRALILLMEGAVTMDDWTGFSIPDNPITFHKLSDGTITFTLANSTMGNSPANIAYNGGGSLRAASNNDTIKPFSIPVINNYTGALLPRDLAHMVLDKDAETPAEVTQVFEALCDMIASGNEHSIVDGDYIVIPYIDLAGEYQNGVQMRLTNVKFIVVAVNFMVGIKGNTRKNFAFQSMTAWGNQYDQPTDNIRDTLTDYLNTNVRDQLINAGVPLDRLGYAPVQRRRYNAHPTDRSDMVFLPTAYTMLGPDHPYVIREQEWFFNGRAEPAESEGNQQGVFTYYKDDSRRIKNAVYATSSAIQQNANSYNTYYLRINTTGGVLITTGGMVSAAPAFCIAP